MMRACFSPLEPGVVVCTLTTLDGGSVLLLYNFQSKTVSDGGKYAETSVQCLNVHRVIVGRNKGISSLHSTLSASIWKGWSMRCWH